MGDSADVRRALAANVTANLPPGAARPGVSILADAPLHIEPVVYANRNATAPAAADAINAALLEWLALSAMDLHIVTYSGYARTAWAYGGKPYAILAAENYLNINVPRLACRIASLPTLALDDLAAGV